jgi:hypothetical protein
MLELAFVVHYESLGIAHSSKKKRKENKIRFSITLFVLDHCKCIDDLNERLGKIFL